MSKLASTNVGRLYPRALALLAVIVTAVFVIRTHKEIVAAANSREFDVESQAPTDELVCKIRPFGDAFVAINGMSSDPPSGYSGFCDH